MLKVPDADSIELGYLDTDTQLVQKFQDVRSLFARNPRSDSTFRSLKCLRRDELPIYVQLPLK